MQDNSTNVNGEQDRASEPNAVPWSGMEILAALYLAWYAWPAVVSLILRGLGLEHWYYGDDVPEMPLRLELWVRTLALPFQVFTIPLLFSSFSGTQPDQLGLTTRYFVRNVLAGVASWLILTPMVFAIFLLLRYLASRLGEPVVEHHALETLARQKLFPAEWAMLFFSATVSAPVVEELTFRGMLLPWLAARRWGGHAAMFGALALAVGLRWQHLQTAWQEGFLSLASAAMPALFVLALLPMYGLICRRKRTAGPALFGVSLLFAYIHAPVWPTPIPLFVLSLGLSILAYRSGSLVGPIVLHGLFNGISCVQLLMA